MPQKRLMITGSDYRSLNHLNEKYPEVDLAFKVAQGTEDVEKAMKRLRFTPKWISFHYTDLSEDIVKKYHDKGRQTRDRNDGIRLKNPSFQ